MSVFNGSSLSDVDELLNWIQDIKFCAGEFIQASLFKILSVRSSTNLKSAQSVYRSSECKPLLSSQSHVHAQNDGFRTKRVGGNLLLFVTCLSLSYTRWTEVNRMPDVDRQPRLGNQPFYYS